MDTDWVYIVCDPLYYSLVHLVRCIVVGKVCVYSRLWVFYGFTCEFKMASYIRKTTSAVAPSYYYMINLQLSNSSKSMQVLGGKGNYIQGWGITRYDYGMQLCDVTSVHSGWQQRPWSLQSRYYVSSQVHSTQSIQMCYPSFCVSALPTDASMLQLCA